MPTDDYIKRSDAFKWVCGRCLDADECENLADPCFVEVSINMIPAADVEPKQRWIPVTERLPEKKINPNTRDFEYVLCATVFGDVRPYKYGAPIGQGEAHFWNGAGYVDAYVTHWMPLPEPPKEEKNENAGL